MTSVYSPSIIAEARLLGITELQAYRNHKAREAVQARRAASIAPR